MRSDEDVLIDLFLEHGADPNLTGGFWGTALGAATAREHMNTMSKLLENGANVNLCGGKRHQRSPLMIACQWNRPTAFSLLLEHKADIDAHSSYGTALQLSAR